MELLSEIAKYVVTGSMIISLLSVIPWTFSFVLFRAREEDYRWLFRMPCILGFQIALGAIGAGAGSLLMEYLRPPCITTSSSETFIGGGLNVGMLCGTLLGWGLVLLAVRRKQQTPPT